MAINCNIVYASNGSIDYINTENGQRSNLFDKLTQTLGGDKNSALTLYALTDSEDFKTVYNDNLSQREKQKSNRGGKIATTATNILRGQIGTNEKNSSGRQKELLEKLAKENNYWIENYKKLGEYAGKGMESEVFLSPDGNSVYKANDLEFYDTPLSFLNTIDKHNELFPESSYELVGFTKREDTKNFAFVLKQPFIQAERGATEEEVGLELKKMGFIGGDTTDYTKDNITLMDLHEGNVLIDAQGNIFFIDPVIFVEEVKESLLEPTVEDVMQYANSLEKELTTEQKIELQDVIMNLGVNNSMEAEAILEDALVNNGIVIFDKAKMLNSGGFNEFEIMQILNSPQKQNEIKEILQALKNTEVIEVDYPKDFVFPQGTELNIFGKQIIKNPYIAQQEIVNKQELSDGVKEEYEALFEGVQSVSNKTILDDQLVDKTDGSGTQIILEQTVTDDYNPALLENLNFITEGFSIAVWENNKEAVAKIVKQIKEDAKINGIDLKNIEEKVFTKIRQELLDFFNAMEDLLENNNAEEFAVRYNMMFDLNTPTTTAIKTDNEFDVVLEDNITEYEAFSKYNLLKKAPNIYRQIEDLNLETMYTITATNKNKTVDEVRKEIQDNPLDLPDFEVDVDTLEKMQLYKNYFNFPREFTNVIVEKQDIEYIKKANKWLLKSENSYYKITKNGLELISNDSITTSRGEMTLPETLKIEIEEPIIAEDLNAQKRKEVMNNPMSVKKLDADYLYVDNNVIAVKNTPTDFIRTPKGIFEIIYDQDNISFYGRVESSDDKPLSNINFDNLKYLETSPELFKKAKQYYTKAEIEKINAEFFEC